MSTIFMVPQCNVLLLKMTVIDDDEIASAVLSVDFFEVCCRGFRPREALTLP